MYSGPRTNKGGDYLRANIGMTSGKLPLREPSPVNGNADIVRKPVRKKK
jgi:hypothetical protein